MGNLALVAEASNFRMLAKLCGQIGDELGGTSRYSLGVFLIQALFKSLVECAPALWLQIDLLSLAFAFGQADVVTAQLITFSVATSLFTMAFTVVLMLEASGNASKLAHAERTECKECLQVSAFLIALATAMYIVMAIIKYAGIFVCPGRNIIVQQLRCSSWPTGNITVPGKSPP